MPVLRKPAFGELLFWLYSVFMAGWFLFPEAPEHYRLYYAGRATARGSDGAEGEAQGAPSAYPFAACQDARQGADAP